MTLFKGYRKESNRLSTWDYSKCGRYFITLNTYHHKHTFGEITDGLITLSPIGQEVERQWVKTPEIRLDMNLRLDAFQVMPNHFHAIIEIGKNMYNDVRLRDHKNAGNSNANGMAEAPYIYKNMFGPQRKNLGSIVRGFKSSVTSFARKNRIPFEWQSDFYDNIIWDARAMHNIRNYIQNNVANWGRDRFRRRDPSQ